MLGEAPRARIGPVHRFRDPKCDVKTDFTGIDPPVKELLMSGEPGAMGVL